MKILFLSLYSGIWAHSKIEISLAEDLKSSGHEIEFLRCDGALNPFCITMTAYGISFYSSTLEKSKVCDQCKFDSKILKDEFAFPQIFLDAFLSVEDKILIQNDLKGLDKNNWLDWNYENFALGRIASYEFLIQNKISNENIPETLWPELFSSLENTIKTFFAAKKILGYGTYDKIIVYNRLYSTNHIFSLVAESFGIPTYSLMASGPMNDQYGRYLLARKDTDLSSINKSVEWLSICNFPLKKFELQRVVTHLNSVFKAKSPWTYSLPRREMTESTIRSRLGISKDAKVVIAALSSIDEIYAAEQVISLKNDAIEVLFKSQLDWIEFLIDNFPAFPEYHLIIRVHPREFPNKRENVTSSNASHLLHLSKLTKNENISFNFPSDEISIYDFIPFVDRILTSNSSVGIEFASVGIPVVGHNPSLNSNFPLNLCEFPTNQLSYLHKIFDHFDDNYLVEKAIVAFRWIYFRNFRISQPVNTQSSKFTFSRLNLRRRIYRRFDYSGYFIKFGKMKICKYFPKLANQVDILGKSEIFPTFRLEENDFDEKNSEKESLFIKKYLENQEL